MRGPWGPQTNIFYFVYVDLVDIYLFSCQLRLKTLDTLSRNLKIFISSQIMLIPGPLAPKGLAVTGGHPRMFLRAHLDFPWPEPYKSRCPCYLENFYLFWNTSNDLLTVGTRLVVHQCQKFDNSDSEFSNSTIRLQSYFSVTDLRNISICAKKKTHNVMYKFIFLMLRSNLWMKFWKIGKIWKELNQTKRIRPTGTFYDRPFQSCSSLKMTCLKMNEIVIVL
jgi:hypothetical protein